MKKLTPLLIDVPHGDKKYMPLYMKLNYKRKRLERDVKYPLKKEAEELLKKYKKALDYI